MDSTAPPQRTFSRDTIDPELANTHLWPTVDENSIADVDQRQLFLDRCNGVKLYLNGVSGKEINAKSGLPIREIARLVKRCLCVHPDGRVYGFRALIPGTRQKTYSRKSKVIIRPGLKYGAAGAFGQLLWCYPVLADLIERYVLKLGRGRHLYESRIPIKSLHKRFIDKCRELGLEVTGQYPFNTKKLGYASLASYVKGLIVDKSDQAAGAVFGKSAAKKMTISDGGDRPVAKPFERVECDAHHIDAIFCILVPSLFGELIPKVVRRLWVIVIKEIVSRAVLGYHISLREECNADDVLQAIKHALTKWEPLQLKVPGMKYAPGAGFPSSNNPRFIGACWDEFSVDGAMANLSSRVASKLKLVVGSGNPLVLKRRSPDDRPFIERFFGALEEGGFHRLPNTTGSAPDDSRRNNAELAACKYFIQVEHLTELADVLIANYNATPHGSIGHRTPLEYLNYLTQESSLIIRQADPIEVGRLLSLYKRVRVNGGVESGRRPFVTFYRVNYTSDVLKKAYGIVGKYITVESDINDLRTIKAYAPNGAEIGMLRAAPPWHRTPHTLTMRQAINSLAARKIIHYVATNDPVMALLDYLETIIRKGKPVPPVYLEARQLLSSRMDELRDDLLQTNEVRAAKETGRFVMSSTSHHHKPASSKGLPPPRKAING